MVLPEIAGKAGTIDNDRIVYIEDYALQYLKILKRTELTEEDKFVLYGKQEKASGKEIYIIYGICRQEERKNYLRAEEKKYDIIGSLSMDEPEKGEDFCQNLLLGFKNGGQPAGGYYVFYDADDKMKDCLSEYYEENTNRSRYIAQREQADRGLAELVALSNGGQREGAALYTWVRIVVTGILIVFCAIAVATINEYGKMSDFVQMAVQTGELMKEP